jgi:hypothetical protein
MAPSQGSNLQMARIFITTSRWKPRVADGGLLYLDRPAGEARLQYFDLATHKSTIVAHDLGNVFLGLTASQDGRTIFYSRVDSSLDDLMLVENFR